MQTGPMHRVPYRRVALLGFMGAGKTTVGGLLAPMLGWRFLDSDALLVERHGCSIADLFAKHGEAQFRDWEAAVVAEALAQQQVVVALGGGAVEHPRTRALLAGEPGTLTVFLETQLPVSLARCASEPGAALRPVLADVEHLHNRFTTRLPLYRSAHLTLSTEAQTPSALARAIAHTVDFRAEFTP